MKSKSKRLGRPSKKFLDNKYDFENILANKKYENKSTLSKKRSKKDPLKSDQSKKTKSVKVQEVITPNEQFVTKEELNEALGDIGEMSFDVKISEDETDAILKLKAFFTILEKVPVEMGNIDRFKVISALKNATINQISENIDPLQVPYQCLDMYADDYTSTVIKQLSEEHNMSFENFLCPPTKICFECGKTLTKNSTSGTIIQCATLTGMQSGTKFSYRCRDCNVVYQYDTYVKNEKHYFYSKPRKFVKASNIMFIERTKLDEYAQLSLHSQVSFEGQAISYNATFREALQKCEDYLSTKTIDKEDLVDEEQTSNDNEVEDDDNDDDDDTLKRGEEKSGEKKSVFGKHDLGRKHVSAATFNYLVEEEMRIREEEYGIAKPLKTSLLGYMEYVDEKRRNELYPHDCHPDCMARGCPYVTSTDGIWKVRFKICQALRKEDCDLGDSYPKTCTNSPMFQSAFCKDCGEEMKKLGVPTNLKDFLRFCGCNVEKYDKQERLRKEMVLKKLADRITVKSPNVGVITGTTMILRSQNFSRRENFQKEGDDDPRGDCNKDTEGIVTMNTYSRGHVMFVHGGGIIRYWGPIFRSESPTQVSILMIKFLGMIAIVISTALWGLIYLFYDNMCNITRLKLWRRNLSMLGFKIFKLVKKGVDTLHIPNHVRVGCKENYPRIIQELRATFRAPNTQSCEQTFSWFGKYNKILNSMPKTKHLFFVHMLIRHRNKYTDWCYARGLKPRLPQAKKESSLTAPLD